jgi:hypothetical protein
LELHKLPSSAIIISTTINNLLLLCPTSIHSQETIGRLLIKMLTIQELPMISQLIAFTMLLDIVESLHQSKLLNQLFMVHNIMILVWLLFTQQTT